VLWTRVPDREADTPGQALPHLVLVVDSYHDLITQLARVVSSSGAPRS